jgi:hypothetical protein
MTVVHRATKPFDAATHARRRPDPADPVRRPAVVYRHVSFSSVLAGEVPPS